jgi:hypothetical protein
LYGQEQQDMARAIERIEREILALEATTRAIAIQLKSAYSKYLATLEQALRQQLVMASYHLCTQGYPKNFLSLSLNQRQQLQQAIRKLGEHKFEQLLADNTSELDKQDQEDEVNEDTVTQENDDTDNSSNELPVPLNLSLFASNPPTVPTSFPPSSPVELAIWQQNMEKAIYETLKKVSREANLALQKSGIFPKKLPEPILEAAAAASEAAAEVMLGPPNLLNLVIEVENGQQSENPNLTQIMAINLRLAEMEFADAALSSERKQIRSILAQLNKVGQEYQKQQKERVIAEAEAAWRASWLDE